MEAIKALFTRRSVRKFVEDKIPELALINKVVEMGTYAPNGMGRQSAIIYVY